MSRSDLAGAQQAVDIMNGPGWAFAAAVSLCEQPLPVRQAIVSAGESEFISQGRHGYQGQGFKTSDIRQIFQAVRHITETDADPMLVASGDLITRVSRVFAD